MNQIPNIEEEFSRKLMNRLADCAARLASPVDAHTELMETLHHQLQKARHDWLREEIVKLEGMRVKNEHTSDCLHNEAPEYCDCNNFIKWNRAFQTIIDRYTKELDHPINREE